MPLKSAPRFDAIVSADAFENLKPAPDIFLAASKILDVPTNEVCFQRLVKLIIKCICLGWIGSNDGKIKQNYLHAETCIGSLVVGGRGGRGLEV